MGEGFYITLFSPSDVTAFHKNEVWRRGCYITLFSPSDVTAFHRIVVVVVVVFYFVFSRPWAHSTKQSHMLYTYIICITYSK